MDLVHSLPHFCQSTDLTPNKSWPIISLIIINKDCSLFSELRGFWNCPLGLAVLQVGLLPPGPFPYRYQQAAGRLSVRYPLKSGLWLCFRHHSRVVKILHLYATIHYYLTLLKFGLLFIIINIGLLELWLPPYYLEAWVLTNCLQGIKLEFLQFH